MVRTLSSPHQCFRQLNGAWVSVTHKMVKPLPYSVPQAEPGLVKPSYALKFIGLRRNVTLATRAPSSLSIARKQS